MGSTSELGGIFFFLDKRNKILFTFQFSLLSIFCQFFVNFLSIMTYQSKVVAL